MWIIRFLDKILGLFVRIFLYSPLIILLTLLSAFRFLDGLFTKGFDKDVFWDIMMDPFYALYALLVSLLTVVLTGYQFGFTEQFLSLGMSLNHVFTVRINKDPNEFFNNGDPKFAWVFHFPGRWIGFLCSKLSMLILPIDSYLANLSFTDSVHNDLNTGNSGSISERLNACYGPRLDNTQEQERVFNAIESLLNQRILRASVGIERAYAQAALRSFTHLKRDSFYFNALRITGLVWMALETELASDHDQTRAQEIFASYLGRIQRGYNLILNPEDDGTTGVDMPECPQGTIDIILSVLSIIPGSNYSLAPTTQEGVDSLRSLLRRRIDRDYELATQVNSGQTISRDSFIGMEKQKVSEYARAHCAFFSGLPPRETDPKASARMARLNQAEVDATLEAFWDEWEIPGTNLV